MRGGGCPLWWSGIVAPQRHPPLTARPCGHVTSWGRGDLNKGQIKAPGDGDDPGFRGTQCHHSGPYIRGRGRVRGRERCRAAGCEGWSGGRKPGMRHL